MKIKPLKNLVLLKPLNQGEEKKSSSGIILPNENKEDNERGEVIAVGEGVSKIILEVEALKLGSDLIEKILAEAQLEAAKKWNGVLPTHMYGSAPILLLNISQ